MSNQRLTLEELKNCQDFFVIAGPCVIESEQHTLFMCEKIKEITDRLGLKLIFKASFDKANRTSGDSFRGPGLEEGLRILQKVKDTYHVPVLTDVHESYQCPKLAEVVDIIQVPAFLCRQTDLLVAVAETKRIIQIKKGQFCSATTMVHAVDKIKSVNPDAEVILCDRGTMFGYGDLVVDFRNLALMRNQNPGCLVAQDITHSLQQPNQSNVTMGLRDLIPVIARAAVAVGVDGIFMEVHDNPEKALSDATTQWPLDKFESLLVQLQKIHRVVE